MCFCDAITGYKCVCMYLKREIKPEDVFYVFINRHLVINKKHDDQRHFYSSGHHAIPFQDEQTFYKAQKRSKEKVKQRH